MKWRNEVQSAFVTQSARVLAIAVCLVYAAGCEKPPAVPTATDANEGKSLPAKPVPVAEANNSDPNRDVDSGETPAASRREEITDVKVIVYYFHRTVRCPTCLAIEEQARKAVETGYEEELAAGKLEWHAVNIEEPGNEHFEDDFGLSTSSLVLVEMKGDEVVRWKDLAKVWELVHEEPAFQKYVWTEVTAFLGI
jgi:hypothetical protein